jgi:hypothetical protein
MKWILFIVLTTSHQNTGATPVAVDHMTFNTERACEEMKAKIEKQPAAGKGFMGAVGAINNTLNGPIINARCESVDDSQTQ